MPFHVALQRGATLAASKCSSQKALKSAARLCWASNEHHPKCIRYTHKNNLGMQERTQYVYMHVLRQKLQRYFDFICLCYSSWKRLCSRQHIISAWAEMTGAGSDPSLFLAFLTAFSSFAFNQSMMALCTGQFPAWTLAPVHLPP